jgi:hypothetical protein
MILSRIVSGSSWGTGTRCRRWHRRGSIRKKALDGAIFECQPLRTEVQSPCLSDGLEPCTCLPENRKGAAKTLPRRHVHMPSTPHVVAPDVSLRGAHVPKRGLRQGRLRILHVWDDGSQWSCRRGFSLHPPLLGSWFRKCRGLGSVVLSGLKVQCLTNCGTPHDWRRL